MQKYILIPLLYCIALFSGIHVQGSPLPQNQSYQVVLRNYIASLSEQDFEIDLEQVSYNEQYFNSLSPDELYRHWILWHDGGASIPFVQGLIRRADWWILSTIEGEGGGTENVRLRLTETRPDQTAWWTTYNYPGNPYFNSQEARNRAFVAVAVGIMMCDWWITENGNPPIDNQGNFDWRYLGGMLFQYANAYHYIKGHFPSSVDQAIQVGFKRLFDILYEWGPVSVNENMSTKTIAALPYLRYIFDDPQDKQAVDNLISKLIYGEYSKIFDSRHHLGLPNHILDASGPEASYNGIALQYIAMAGNADRGLHGEGRPLVDVLLDRMSKFKAHMTLPEPQGNNYFSISHYNQRTTGDWANDQHRTNRRDLGIAMESEEAIYFAFGGRSNYSWSWAVPTVSLMKSSIENGMSWINNELTANNDFPPSTWSANWSQWWAPTINTVFDFYKPGFYDHLLQLRNNVDPIIDVPVRRPGDITEVFYGTEVPDPPSGWDHQYKGHLFLKRDSYAAIINTSHTSWNNGGTWQGVGSGDIAAFWTEETGPLILARRYRDSDPWSILFKYPVHSVNGRTPNGRFSTMPLNSPRVTINHTDEFYETVVERGLGADNDYRAVENESVFAEAEPWYRRWIRAYDDSISVKTKIESPSGNPIEEMYESIPLFLYDENRQENGVPHEIHFWIADQWVEATTELQHNVTFVRVRRFTGEMFIEFTQPRSVKLSDIWKERDGNGSNIMMHTVTRNILVDMLNGQTTMPEISSVEYRIFSDPEGSNNLLHISIINPKKNEVFYEGDNIQISSYVNRPDEEIENIEYFANGQSIGITYESPFNYNWTGVDTGSYSLIAKVTTTDNMSSESSPIDIIVILESDLAVTDLWVATGKNYEIIDYGLYTGELQYIDRNFEFTSVSQTVQGATYIKTANEDKMLSVDDFMSFNVNRNVIVYIAYDNRLTNIPLWLQSFTDTGETINSGALPERANLHKKEFPAGFVNLGSNEGVSSSSMYTVIIMPADSDSTLAPVQLFSPPDGYIVPPDEIIFEWEELNDADNYHLQVAYEPGFSEFVVDNPAINETQYVVTDLEYSTTYYWRVRGENEHGPGFWSNVWSFTTISQSVEQDIPLIAGWNMISSYVSPDDPDIVSIFSDIGDNLVIVKSGGGNEYWPEYDINDIGNWNFREGYQVYVTNPDVLTITGDLITPESTPIELPAGWSMIAYLRKSEMDVETAISGITDNLGIISNNQGEVYWPEHGINTMDVMEPGQGYKVFMNSASVLTYPPNEPAPQHPLAGGEGRQSTPASNVIPSHYQLDFDKTGVYAILLVVSSGLQDNDEVGVWDPANRLVGSGVAENGRALVTVWGRDTYIENNGGGAKTGDKLQLTIWSSEEEREYPVSFTSVRDIANRELPVPVLTFEPDAVWIADVEGLSGIPERYTLEQNYPNPFNPSTTIRYGLPSDEKVRLEVYNMLGQRIAVLVDEEQRAGYHHVVFDATRIASGVYFYRLQVGNFVEVKRMMLLR